MIACGSSNSRFYVYHIDSGRTDSIAVWIKMPFSTRYPKRSAKTRSCGMSASSLLRCTSFLSISPSVSTGDSRGLVQVWDITRRSHSFSLQPRGSAAQFQGPRGRRPRHDRLPRGRGHTPRHWRRRRKGGRFSRHLPQVSMFTAGKETDSRGIAATAHSRRVMRCRQKSRFPAAAPSFPPTCPGLPRGLSGSFGSSRQAGANGAAGGKLPRGWWESCVGRQTARWR